MYRDMDQTDRLGLAAWHLYSGDGKFIRMMGNEVPGFAGGYVDMLATLDSRERRKRFEQFGLMNDPGCVPRWDAASSCA